MKIEVKMPQMGESVVEGTILKWLVKEGDKVEKEQSLVEISTDKIDVEVPSPGAGIVEKILAAEGDTVEVDKPVLILEVTEEKKEEIKDEAEKKAEIKEDVIRPAGEELLYSPAVRALAREHNIDLALVKGTGEGGRVTRKDLLDFIESGKTAKPAETPKEGFVPLTPIRKFIAERMVASKRISAHVTTVLEADFTNINKFRKANKEKFAQEGIKLTSFTFLIKATAIALKEFPIINSSFTEEGILYKPEIDIGIAVALEEGLIVPSLKDPLNLNLPQIAEKVQDIAARARAGKLHPEELKDSSFTLTNHGGAGSLLSTPIINQPNVGILGLGMVEKRIKILDDNTIAIKEMAYLSFTYDHRIFDGSKADAFVSRICKLLKSWNEEWM